MTPEQKLRKMYDEGFKDGLRAYAWWKDGVQRVGSTVYTLDQAIEDRKQTLDYMPKTALKEVI